MRRIQFIFDFILRLLPPLNEALFLKPLRRNRAPKSVLFVCKGNICRSPYAAVRLKMLKPNLTVASAGLEAGNGVPADARAIQIAKEFNVDLSTHKAQRFTDELAALYDLIIVMEPHQRAALPSGKTIVLGALNVPQGGSVVIRDPYGKSEEKFRGCFKEIDQALNQLLSRCDV